MANKDYDLKVEDNLENIKEKKVVKDNLKENVEKASDFLESCFDENNPDDDLSFDERVNQRKKELLPEVLEIVESAQVFTNGNGLKEPIFTGEKVTEDNEDSRDIKAVLINAYSMKDAYKEKKRELKEKQAKIRLETEWGTAIKDRPRPNDEDKKAYITLATLDLQAEVDELEAQSQFAMDVYKLEKLLLQL